MMGTQVSGAEHTDDPHPWYASISGPESILVPPVDEYSELHTIRLSTFGPGNLSVEFSSNVTGPYTIELAFENLTIYEKYGSINRFWLNSTTFGFDPGEMTINLNVVDWEGAKPENMSANISFSIQMNEDYFDLELELVNNIIEMCSNPAKYRQGNIIISNKNNGDCKTSGIWQSAQHMANRCCPTWK